MKTAIGLGVGALILFIVHLWNGGAAGDLLQPAALVFVIFGTLLSTFVSAEGSDFRRAVFSGAASAESVATQLRKELGNLAAVARKEGFLALDALKASASRASLREGIQYLVSGFDQSAIRDLFDTSLERQSHENDAVVRVWEIAAQAAPSVGALGATLGLLSALTKLDDPAQLGRGIASAMAAVLYGFFFSNFVFSPLAARKRRTISQALIPDEMVKTAILGIQEGLNPHLIDERLRQFSA
jgi:chemotaxis protein MotA